MASSNQTGLVSQIMFYSIDKVNINPLKTSWSLSTFAQVNKSVVAVQRLKLSFFSILPKSIIVLFIQNSSFSTVPWYLYSKSVDRTTSDRLKLRLLHKAPKFLLVFNNVPEMFPSRDFQKIVGLGIFSQSDRIIFYQSL